MVKLTDNQEKILEYKKRAKELVSQMTLEEKCSQMLNKSPAIPRLGIKAYNWWNESLHGVARAGVATVFPQAIGLAASFDDDMLKSVADAVATEGRAKFNLQQKYGDYDIYKGITSWAPNVNIFRDPRWGRGHETYGEDPYLTSRMGVSFVEGLQGEDENYLKVAAGVKHYAVHSGPEDIRHSFNAEVSKQDLWETYLPAFEACITKAKAESIMGAYNRTNSEPCCGSQYLLVDTLRNKWKFDGHVISDCWAIKDFHEGHHVTDGPVDSVALAVEKGCDLNCGSIFLYLQEAVKEGKVTEEQITKAVERLMTTRMKLGMFDESTPFDTIDYSVVDSDKMVEMNLETAKKCLVLLKNENNTLPLDSKVIRSIGVIGPNANNRKALVGNYEGTSSRYITVLEGIQDYAKEENIRVYYSEGCHLFKERTSSLGEKNDRISEVRGVCDKSDVVIAVLGLDAGLEGEEGDAGNQYASGDKANLNLPGVQEEVLETICKCNKPVILVLLSGSALAVEWADQHVPAILQGWYPGAQGGKAIAEALFGKFSPEGRLPVTFYRTTEELPAFTDYAMKNRTYRYMKQQALYPFGYGLGYCKFSVNGVEVSSREITDSSIDIFTTVRNEGKLRAATVVEVYVKACMDGTPNASLKQFCKVMLNAGEEQRIKLTLPSSAFTLCNEDGKRIVEVGQYQVFVGESQPDKRSIELTGQKPICIDFTAKNRIELG